MKNELDEEPMNLTYDFGQQSLTYSVDFLYIIPTVCSHFGNYQCPNVEQSLFTFYHREDLPQLFYGWKIDSWQFLQEELTVGVGGRKWLCLDIFSLLHLYRCGC